MTYKKAETMRQELIVALQYKDLFPERYIEIAKKYTSEQWTEAAVALIENLENEKKAVYQLLELARMARKVK